MSYLFFKRSIDIVGALSITILVLPVLIIISLAYLFEPKKGPIFFKQKRAGKNGKMFYIYKFRSMAIDAEERLKREPELYKKYVKKNYKLEPHEDPRITKMGAFLRKTSMDELPQLINVLKGEMSLVGPRPVVEPELAEYGERVAEFLSVKPGITGYWQVSGRSNVVYPERVDIELYYVKNRSFYFDLKILFLTVINVLLRKGAY
ncbi:MULTISPECIES: sugar transferase [Shouchella]|uniref:sugar transferase n=1 Tax=Shouchella TaxID=2893057 RepID=UPI000BA52609|nr:MULTISPECIES: sugar transferase [Shouchella]MCM3378796.1 sugar transferase [Shouchella rhizosphaerae]PAD17303.1 multidrug MFS transporter [Shouchella clausii]